MTDETENTDIVDLDLDDIFDRDTTEETDDAEVEQTPEPKPPETDEADTKGETKDDEDKTEESEDTAPPADETKSVPIEALQDTRRKLNSERERAEAAEAKLAKIEANNAPDPKEDPDAYKAYVESSGLKTKIHISRELMAEHYPDFGDMEVVFIEMTDKDPSLIAKMHVSAHPGKFAYEAAKQHLEIEELRDPKYRGNLKAELLAEIKAEQGETEEATPSEAEARKAAAVKVPNLTNAPTKGSNSTPTVSLDSLDDILGD